MTQAKMVEKALGAVEAAGVAVEAVALLGRTPQVFELDMSYF